MYFCINGGNVSFGEKTVLEDIRFEIHTGEKIAVVGRNGSGKTTLLKAISGEYEIENGDISKDKDLEIGTLSQIAFEDDSETMGNELLKAFYKINAINERLSVLQKEMEADSSEKKAEEFEELTERYRLLGGYYFQKDYESVIKNFGFTKEDKAKKLSEFSGGQRTKIAFMKLLLSKPDLLLLDEPTNHLDINAAEWLEEYIRNYPYAVIIVSHDRMFLDKTVDVVYDIEHKKIKKYHGNYSKFTETKKELYLKQLKEYEKQQKEIERLNDLAERFRYKATKAKMVQSKLKYIERMDLVEPPERFDLKAFYSDLTPKQESGGDVLFVKDLAIGYDEVLSTLNFELKKNCKVGIIGANGLGKSTFLKTLMGLTPALSGEFRFGTNVIKGYFDQQMAERKSEKTLFEDYREAFPYLTDTEIRSDLGAFLFSGDTVFKKLSVLSGGERVRLALCKLFKKKPNFLILDEPTNHTDIVGKEALGNMLKEYTGSLICVSHDRYFIKQVCDSLLIFNDDKTVTFYPHDFESYEKSKQNGFSAENTIEKSQKTEKKAKKITPLKQSNKLKIKIGHLEEKIALKEEEIDGLKAELDYPENSSDYLKLAEIGELIENAQTELDILMSEWEKLTLELENLNSLI
ncbi:MAG: ABC-F family ATP-binding cassette domain-containing protein [Clostridia bacterium]|nr:ABC-F family ATP-binding cassette domain-containing protein [Clostridia bacterium]